ncbi:hypothetical protein SAMN02745206_02025 [Desulfacinum infernum DSM 9756]|uniref:Glycosyltransferase 2-like domain-containing protein n=1 Tax=Desulfacinum infernum DSM 9756 TaxID=1121391 RepID=A0A1M5BUF6_9BACT|nr:TIGR04282 family arsenosugar biosynthesis glycosyltransferase [Desulfacinum infernum]SHF46075.1 hypothetical protein SAMN02745206_02025 [Desulfacinum infernum DSM 9756]
MNRNALILFARNPEPGRVKTRLAKHIGDRAACNLYERLLRFALGLIEDFRTTAPRTDVFAAVTPAESVPTFRDRFSIPWAVFPQEGDHLGERMALAFRKLFLRGYDRVLLLGSDLADVNAQDLQGAFRALDGAEAVLGPAEDGGFYAVGLRRPCPAAFQDPQWGTSDVLERTLKALKSEGLATRLLPARRDVDRPEDLSALRRHWAFSSTVSVVVPTLAPRHQLMPWIQGLRKILWPGDELCVVRGVSGAQAPPRRSDGVLWLESPPGRGRQLNHGARTTSGNILWFLHDDCLPGPSAAYQVRKIMLDVRFSLGCFRLGFSPTNRALDAIAAWANGRTRIFRLPYGDQGLFCRRDVFDAVGGFARPFLMEDVDFARACRSHGRLLFLPETIFTSPRRYLDRGILRASISNHLTLFAHFLGLSNATLYQRYYKGRALPIRTFLPKGKDHGDHQIFHP